MKIVNLVWPPWCIIFPNIRHGRIVSGCFDAPSLKTYIGGLAKIIFLWPWGSSNFWVCRDRTLGQFCQAGDGEIIDCAKLANELFHYIYLHVLKPSCIILKETYIISRNGIIKRWVSFTIRIKSNLIHFTGSRFARTWVSIRTGSVTLWSEKNAKCVPKTGSPVGV